MGLIHDMSRYANGLGAPEAYGRIVEAVAELRHEEIDGQHYTTAALWKVRILWYGTRAIRESGNPTVLHAERLTVFVKFPDPETGLVIPKAPVVAEQLAMFGLSLSAGRPLLYEALIAQHYPDAVSVP